MVYIFSAANPGIEFEYYVMAGVISLVTGVAAGCCCVRGKLSRSQAVALVLLTAYTFLVFASTIFSRTSKAHYSYKLMPFWSYRRILKGSKSLFWEDVFNVIMLMPIGILLPIVMGEYADGYDGKRRESVFRYVVLAGFFVSATIEVLQLVLKRGLFEFDDMFHNTLGAVAGYWICRLVRYMYKRCIRKK